MKKRSIGALAYKNIQNKQKYEFELEEDKLLFKRILTCIDLNQY